LFLCAPFFFSFLGSGTTYTRGGPYTLVLLQFFVCLHQERRRMHGRDRASVLRRRQLNAARLGGGAAEKRGRYERSVFRVLRKGVDSESEFKQRLAHILKCKSSRRDVPCGDLEYQCFRPARPTGRRNTEERTNPPESRGYQAIDKDYVERNMIDRTTLILFYESTISFYTKSSETRNLRRGRMRKYARHTMKRMDGFILAYTTREGNARPEKRGNARPEKRGNARPRKRRNRFFYVDLICSRHRKGRKLLDMAEKYARTIRVTHMALRAASKGLIPYYQKLGYSKAPNNSPFNTNVAQHGYWMEKELEED
jgi:GNAT superfamily N-acetyltransferase